MDGIVSGPQNATYTSHEIQNDLLQIREDIVNEQICTAVKKGWCIAHTRF